MTGNLDKQICYCGERGDNTYSLQGMNTQGFQPFTMLEKIVTSFQVFAQIT